MNEYVAIADSPVAHSIGHSRIHTETLLRIQIPTPSQAKFGRKLALALAQKY